MDESYEMLKVYCDKQKVMIADLLSKVLMLETKLEVLQAQRKSEIDEIVEQEKINKSNSKKSPSRSGQLR